MRGREPVRRNSVALGQYIDSDTVTVYTYAMTTNAQPLLTIDELAMRADVPVRTIRFYIAEGLLPGASTRGKGASYTQEHLDRLQLIRLLVARHLPLAEIGALVTRLPSGEVRAVLEEEQERIGEVSAHTSKPPSPKEYLSALLDQARGYPGYGNTGGSLGSGGAGAKAWQRRKEAAQPAHFPLPTVPTPPAQSPSAQALQRGQAVPWQRWELASGIELQVRTEVAQTQPEVIERVLNAVRAVLAHGTVDRPQQEE